MRELAPAEFGGLFDACKTAFRYETLQYFPSDAEAFEASQLGEKMADDSKARLDMIAWEDTLLAAHQRGATFTRVRLVVEPLSAYVRWELVNYCSMEQGFVLPTINPDHSSIGSDFWLFDGLIGVRMAYTIDGHFDGAYQMGSVYSLRRHRDTLLAASVPLDRYLETLTVRS